MEGGLSALIRDRRGLDFLERVIEVCDEQVEALSEPLVNQL
jgi:hypothetical protein